jgi:CDP-glucose 4,6-dehydratase
MHFLITGHTGFKGAWLIALLKSRGHKVSGISLEPEANSIFLRGSLRELLEMEFYVDIRDRGELHKAVSLIKPEFVIHMAAQPLVRNSYVDPVSTFQTNILGTTYVLEAIQVIDSIVAGLIITTDKVYKNIGKRDGYIENDSLGGFDPYSSSKAAADIVTQSWSLSFPGKTLGIARAGNVIGGGDWAKDRIIPDYVRAHINSTKLRIRNPRAVRPWQHVLDCLNGYLLMTEYLLKEKESLVLNFGPDNFKTKTVLQLIDECNKNWESQIDIEYEETQEFKETEMLVLDSSKARQLLGWSERMDFETAIKTTLDYYKQEHKGIHVLNIMLQQIAEFGY